MVRSTVRPEPQRPATRRPRPKRPTMTIRLFLAGLALTFSSTELARRNSGDVSTGIGIGVAKAALGPSRPAPREGGRRSPSTTPSNGRKPVSGSSAATRSAPGISRPSACSIRPRSSPPTRARRFVFTPWLTPTTAVAAAEPQPRQRPAHQPAERRSGGDAESGRCRLCAERRRRRRRRSVRRGDRRTASSTPTSSFPMRPRPMPGSTTRCRRAPTPRASSSASPPRSISRRAASPRRASSRSPRWCSTASRTPPIPTRSAASSTRTRPSATAASSPSPATAAPTASATQAAWARAEELAKKSVERAVDDLHRGGRLGHALPRDLCSAALGRADDEDRQDRPPHLLQYAPRRLELTRHSGTESGVKSVPCGYAIAHEVQPWSSSSGPEPRLRNRSRCRRRGRHPDHNARQAVTNHNVRYVLAISLGVAILVLIVAYFVFFAG